MKAKLTRISGGEALRTDTIEGFTNRYPQVGKQFIMMGKPLNSLMNIRAVNTSPVVLVEETAPNYFTITTQSGSVYSVEVFPEELPEIVDETLN